jgi:excisionase family DNA binding protein
MRLPRRPGVVPGGSRQAAGPDAHVGGRSQRQRYLTSGQAADRLGVSPRTVARWVDDHRLICTYTLGGHRRFRVVDIELVAAEMAAPTHRGTPASAAREPASGRHGAPSA